MTLQAIFAKVLNDQPERITDECSTDTHKRWDSFRTIQLVVAMEKAFHVKFTTAEIQTLTTFKRARELLRDKGVSV